MGVRVRTRPVLDPIRLSTTDLKCLRCAVRKGRDEGGCLARDYVYVTEESEDHLRTSRKRVLRVGTSPKRTTRQASHLGLLSDDHLGEFFVQLEFPLEFPLL